MPIYEYRCQNCQQTTEILQRVDDAVPPCPACGGELRRLVSAPAFQFKGEGWYVTDYARKRGGAAGGSATDKGESAAASGSTSGSGSEGGASSKPAESSASTPSATPSTTAKE